MSGRAPKFIYFDLGNVLLTFDHRRAARQLSELVQVGPDDVWEFLFASGLQDRYEQGAVTSCQVHQQFCSHFCGDDQHQPSYERFHRANSDIFQLNVPIVPLVAQLAAAGYPLGVLSNTCEEHWKHVACGRYRIIEVAFAQYILSFELQSSKPGAEIYTAAVKQAGCEPHEVFFMDDRAENVQGALDAGLDAVEYRSPQLLAAELRARGVRWNY